MTPLTKEIGNKKEIENRHVSIMQNTVTLKIENNFNRCVEDGVLAVPHSHPVRSVHVHPPPPPSPSPRLLLR